MNLCKKIILAILFSLSISLVTGLNLNTPEPNSTQKPTEKVNSDIESVIAAVSNTTEPNESISPTSGAKAESKEEHGILHSIVSWFSSSGEVKHNESPVIVRKHKQVIIGLALGGGAAKGFAHIGVIKALEENGIHPIIVTGTSAGSLVGSLYAYGYSTAQLEKIAYQLDEVNLADFTLSQKGLIKGQKLQDFVNKSVHNTQLQHLKLKFAAIATDLDSGQSIGFGYGNTGAAVRASCSIPNIFIPVTINHHRYVDGGLSVPVPVSYAKNMGANLVIAVDITAKPENTKADGFLSNFNQTLNIMGVRLLNEQLKLADFVVTPDITKLSSFTFDNKQQAIALGYAATLPLIPKIKAKIAALQNE